MFLRTQTHKKYSYSGFQIMAAGVTLRDNLVIGMLYEGTLGDREFKMVNLILILNVTKVCHD